MKRQQWTEKSVGAIVRIKVDDYYCFGQIVSADYITFFDYRSTTPDINLTELNTTPILFTITVYHDIITRGVWEKIGKLPVREELKVLPFEFIHDDLKPADKGYELYNPITGEITPCTKDDIKGLECCAVWDDYHVEDRLRCHYEGKPCVWVAQLFENTCIEYGKE